MVFPPEILRVVAGRIERVREECAGYGVAVIEAAERFDVLPLMAGWTGFTAMTRGGDIVDVDLDEDSVMPVTGVHCRDISILRAAKDFPELEALIPHRTAQARECDSCGGTGQLHVDGKVIERVTCWCGGLGWIPEHWPDPAKR